MKAKRAAHFVSSEYLIDNPSNNSLISALLDLGFEIDIFTPGVNINISHYGPGVKCYQVEFGYRWLVSNLMSSRWFHYSLFTGTTEDPMAIAGVLARVYRKRCITIADEIKNGSTSGNRSQRWKALCRFGMRAANLTVVNDAERIEVQRNYANLDKNHQIVVMPNCFRDPPAAGDRQALRRERGFPDDALVVCYSGVFSRGNGGMWFVKALAKCTDVWFWGQVVPEEPMVGEMLRWLQGSDRLVVEAGPLGWRFPWKSMAAADIGVVVYLQDAPQFKHMGVASNRLCMFLTMGIPVIASRQASFQFIETYDCGILVESQEEFVAAISKIRLRLAEMRQNAIRCSREHINAPGRYRELVSNIEAITTIR